MSEPSDPLDRYRHLVDRVRELETERDAAVGALQGIVAAAVEHGVNDQVGEAIAHAEVVMGTRR